MTPDVFDENASELSGFHGQMVRGYNEFRGWSAEDYPSAAATEELLLDV